jgi:hypothetical protein
MPELLMVILPYRISDRTLLRMVELLDQDLCHMSTQVVCPKELVMVRVHRQGVGRVPWATTCQALHINKDLGPMVVVVCMRYKTNFWICHLVDRRL